MTKKFTLWLADRSAIDQGLLPYLIAKVSLESNWSGEESREVLDRVTRQDFVVEPAPERGGVNVVFEMPACATCGKAIQPWREMPPKQEYALVCGVCGSTVCVVCLAQKAQSEGNRLLMCSICGNGPLSPTRDAFR